MTKQFNLFEDNIKRVDSLCGLYEQVKESPKRPTIIEADTLRAAVVFLHSALENYLRGILIEWLPKKGGEDALKNIPLLNLEHPEHRAEKCSLSDLKKFSEKNVLELISESVKQYMGTVSFNNVTEICSWIKKSGIKFE